MGKKVDAQKPADNGGPAEAIAQLERCLEQKDELARCLRDQCRYQHLMLLEIYGLSDPESKAPFRDLQMIHAKAQAALSAAYKSGLLS